MLILICSVMKIDLFNQKKPALLQFIRSACLFKSTQKAVRCRCKMQETMVMPYSFLSLLSRKRAELIFFRKTKTGSVDGIGHSHMPKYELIWTCVIPDHYLMMNNILLCKAKRQYLFIIMYGRITAYFKFCCMVFVAAAIKYHKM